jgi:hypothetical protein
VRKIMGTHRHKTLATLRRDGSPRISGIEAEFRDGEVWLGSMTGAVKALDLRRDPRMALHGASEDPVEDDPGSWPGDAKLSGKAVEITDPAALKSSSPPGEESHLFRIDITEVVVTSVDADAQHLVIELWQENVGHRVIRRK